MLVIVMVIFTIAMVIPIIRIVSADAAASVRAALQLGAGRVATVGGAPQGAPPLAMAGATRRRRLVLARALAAGPLALPSLSRATLTAIVATALIPLTSTTSSLSSSI